MGHPTSDLPMMKFNIIGRRDIFYGAKWLLSSLLVVVALVTSTESSCRMAVCLDDSGTFIQSTLAGSCRDPSTGAVDSLKLWKNMNCAIEA